MLKHYLLRNAILWNLFLLEFIFVPIGRQLSVKCRFASFFVLNHTRAHRYPVSYIFVCPVIKRPEHIYLSGT